MADQILSVYLNDHLAGSVVAVELIERRIARDEGSAPATLLASLLREIREDQAVLEDLIGRAGGEPSAAKKAGAWLLEKLGRLKFRDGSFEQEQLTVFEELEALALGIHGKRALWRMMEAVYSGDPRFGDVDFAGLEQRAADQHDRVEALRLEVAAVAFAR